MEAGGWEGAGCSLACCCLMPTAFSYGISDSAAETWENILQNFHLSENHHSNFNQMVPQSFCGTVNSGPQLKSVALEKIVQK